jgi:two-component system alkaline phosphatase synthesis response regulator PhoP
MKKKIYIADDDPGLIELLSDFFEDRGYEAEGSADLLDLILLNAAKLPDAFLLNIEMWGDDSEIVCSYLKNNEPTNTVPLILFSTLPCADQKSTRYAEGFFSIPFEINELLVFLEKVTS